MKQFKGTAEHSLVTVLVVDLVDSTGHIAGADPSDAEELLDLVFAHVKKVIEHAGGLLVSFAGDGGIAVFGWPESQEDHALYACEAAWSLQNPDGETHKTLLDSNGQRMRFRVGVHSGLVGLRLISLDVGTRLDTVGGTVHLAAALEKKAPPGEILVSSDTVELCRTALALEPADQLAQFDSIGSKVFTLRGPPAPGKARDRGLGIETEVVGRSRELEAIHRILTADRQEGMAVALVGEPGIGKSRIATQICDDIRAIGWQVLEFKGDAQKTTAPFSAFVAILLEALQIDGFDSAEQLGQILTRHHVQADTVRVLTSILAPPEKGRHGSFTATQITRALVDALVMITSSERYVLAVDDLHYLDIESMDCLRLLASQGAASAVPMLITGRPEALPDAERIAATVLRLEPVEREPMRQLARRLWPGDVPAPDLLERVLDRADGIPFVLEQILHALRSDPSDAIDPMPRGVESLIHARLNKLSTDAKSLAQVLSVLGEQSDFPVAQRTSGSTEKALVRNLTELARLEIIYPLAASKIRFRHSIIADACRETVPRKRKIMIHRGAMNAISQTFSDLGDQHEKLAIHAEGAGEDETALEFHWQAAQHARRRSASGSLGVIFERALECIERIGEPAEQDFVKFVLMAFDSMQQIGQFREMNTHLSRAMQLARKHGHQNQVCAVLCHMAMVSWFEGRYGDGLKESEKAVKIASKLDYLPLVFASKFMLACVLHGMGRMERAIGLLTELMQTLSGKLETARLGAAGIPSSIVRSYLCWFYMEVGRYDEGLDLGQQGLEIAVRENEPYSELLARIGLGRCLLKLKRYDEAAECLQIAQDSIRKHGYHAALPHVTGLQASALAGIGEGQRAVEMAEAWLDRPQEMRTGRLELYYLNAGYAEALFQVGQPQKAIAAASRAIEIGRDIENPCLVVQGLALRAQLLKAADPASSQIEDDLAEQKKLCRKHGLVAGRFTVLAER